MFKHDEETNRLSLQEGRHEPWRRVDHWQRTPSASEWLYCRDCVDRYFETGKRAHGHIPYRDRASQSLLRPPLEKEKVQSDTQEEPEVEPASPENDEQEPALEGVVPEAGEAVEDDDTLPQVSYPTLEQYQEIWARKLAEHSRPVPGEFGRDNLVRANTSIVAGLSVRSLRQIEIRRRYGAALALPAHQWLHARTS